jgi:hypothetical protein
VGFDPLARGAGGENSSPGGLRLALAGTLGRESELGPQLAQNPVDGRGTGAAGPDLLLPLIERGAEGSGGQRALDCRIEVLVKLLIRLPATR